MFSDYNGIKLENSKKKIHGKISKYWKLTYF